MTKAAWIKHSTKEKNQAKTDYLAAIQSQEMAEAMQGMDGEMDLGELAKALLTQDLAAFIL